MQKLGIGIGLEYSAAMSVGALGRAGTSAQIVLSNSAVQDNTASGSTVGTLSVAGGTGTFSLVSNPGSLFSILGTALKTASTLTAGSYPITVRFTGTPTVADKIITIIVWTAVSNSVAPAITGSAVQGVTLSVSNGTWAGAPAPSYTYQWKRATVAITGATASTYVVQSADVGSAITCTVTAANAYSSASATSSATASVTKTTLSYTPVTTASVGNVYTGATPSTSGGTSAYTYSVTGTLPTGLSLNTSTGVISGTPTTVQTASGVALVATDANGVTDTSATFSIDVSLLTAPVLAMDPAWDTSQASPIFDIDAAFVAGDDLQFETEASGAGWAAPTVVNHTVTSGELAGSQISLGLGAFANGNWEARCKFKHSGGSYSSYSNVQAFTIAAAASNTPTYYFLGF